MNQKIPKFEKVFSRDFTLAKVEIWYRGEAKNPKGWTDKKQPYSPYIIFERSDGTVGCYYDERGVQWIKNLLLKKARREKDFLTKIENTIKEKIKDIRSVYEEETLLNYKKLIKFLDNIESVFPWLEAMWWFCEMSSTEINNLDITKMQRTRELTNKLSAGTDTVIRKSLKRIFPKLKNFVGVVSGEEVRSKKFPTNDILRERDKRYFYTDNKLYLRTTKKEIEKKYKIKLEDINIDKNLLEVRGTSAYPGFITGRVKRVIGHKQINQIKKGEILVSPMTMTDFLPAMKKAVAIITDEGGITCHAAIVAREINKPCIIGTKIATKVLKDGDLVEVDANKGIVSILKRKRT